MALNKKKRSFLIVTCPIAFKIVILKDVLCHNINNFLYRYNDLWQCLEHRLGFPVQMAAAPAAWFLSLVMLCPIFPRCSGLLVCFYNR